MTRAERLRELFEKACCLPPDDRVAFLDRECDGDAELHRELRRLLEADERAEAAAGTAVIAAPVGGIAADLSGAQTTPEVPHRIGAFRVVERLGEGGMGVVYRAEQLEPIRREVALKLIRGGSDSSSIAARFEAERQALALMDHPNVARVFEAGATDEGVPYFAMEYVRGVPITAYCAEKRLTIEERVRLFLHVCAGVQHAHHRGILHRDLKPSNIVVGRNIPAVPKIIDFGIAKAMGEKLTDNSPETRVGTTVGTPQYMSPEQARGISEDVDLRSDVYSLGIVLFEMLTGELPRDLSGLSITEATRRICETAPKRLGAADRRFRGDLETIVARALENDPARRYPSPGALADDLERWLAGRPILARPPSVAYQLRKLVGRHRLPSALLALLLVVAGAAFVLNVAARRSAEREAAIASNVEGLLTEMLRSADPFGKHGSDVTVRQLVDEFDGGAMARLKDEPEVEVRLRRWLAIAYDQLGAYDKEYEQTVRQLELVTGLYGPRSVDAGKVLTYLGWIRHQQTRYEEAAGRFRESMQILERTKRSRPELYAAAESGLADVLNHLGRYDEARADALQALEGYTVHGEIQPAAGQTFVNLAILERKVGDLDAAEGYARRALSLAKAGKAAGYGTSLLAVRELAETLIERHDCSAAEALLRDQFETFEKVYKEGHPSLLLASSLLGESLLCQQRYEEAEVVLRGIDPQSPSFRYLDDPEAEAALDRLARVYEALGNADAARRYRRLENERSSAEPLSE